MPVGMAAGGRAFDGVSDRFRYAHAPVPGRFRLDAIVASLGVDGGSGGHDASAGVMVRAGLSPDAACVMVRVQADGRIVLTTRAQDGEEAIARTLGASGLPVGLGLARGDAGLIVRHTDAGGRWHSIPLEPEFVSDALSRVGSARVGLAASGGAPGSAAEFASVALDVGPIVVPLRDPPGIVKDVAYGEGLLDNGSFDRATEGADDAPLGWGVWGEGLTRRAGWWPWRHGGAMLAYDHASVTGEGGAGVFRDVHGLEPGTLYELRAWIHPDKAGDGAVAFGSVEMRLEGVRDSETQPIASGTYTSGDLAPDAWNEVVVRGRASNETMRVAIDIAPGDAKAGLRRGGVVRIDAVSLARAVPIAQGTLRVSEQFGSGMVLQRGGAIPVFGRAEPGARVDVELADQRAGVVAGADGSWRVVLGAMQAGGPHVLRVRAGDESLVLTDVLVGDVWLASGQSNMEWPLHDTEGGAGFVESAGDYPGLRLFHAARGTRAGPASEPAGGAWARSGPESARYFSAVAHHFGRLMHEHTGVPIGLVHASWGGSAIRSWLPQEGGRSPDYVSDDPVVRSTYPERAAAAFDAELARWMDMALPASGADGTWTAIDEPGVFELALGGVDGVVWLRKAFELPAGAGEEAATLSLGPVDDYDRTYVNGVLIGSTSREPANAWDYPRVYRLPAGVLREGTNELLVQVLDTGGAGGLHGEADQLYLETVGGTRVELAGEWEAKLVRSMSPSERFGAPTIGPMPNFGARGAMYNAMIAPWTRVPVAGYLWYQGESDAGTPERYQREFAGMIRSWRDAWTPGDLRGDGQTPFLFVQLSSFGATSGTMPGSAWALLREAQAVALGVPATGMAVTVDIGDADDIHPRNKLDVARRLFLEARRVALHEAGVVSHGPRAVGASAIGDGAVGVRFEPGGLRTTDRGPVRAFGVEYNDGSITDVVGRVEGDRVVLTVERAREVVRVYYAWSDVVDPNLVGATGLPAEPVRLDVR